MPIGAMNGVSFKGETVNAESKATAPAIATPMATTPPKIKKDSVSFGKKAEKQIEYDKTHFYTITGSIVGGIVGIISAISAVMHPGGSKVQKGFGAVAAVVLGPLLGAGGGALVDLPINKTVKNTTTSILKNLEKEKQAENS